MGLVGGAINLLTGLQTTEGRLGGPHFGPPPPNTPPPPPNSGGGHFMGHYKPKVPDSLT